MKMCVISFSGSFRHAGDYILPKKDKNVAPMLLSLERLPNRKLDKNKKYLPLIQQR